MSVRVSGLGQGERLRQVTVMGQSFRVAVRSGTDPSLPALVLCNGIGASLEVLQPFVDALPPELTVIRFDVPGVGGSPTPTFPYTYPSLAWALGKLLTRLNFARVDILGMSWGGGLAQQFALSHPDRCRKLVLVSTATGALMVPAKPQVLRRMMTPRRFYDRAYARKIAADVYGGALRDRPSESADLLQNHLRLGSRRGYLFQLLAIAGWTSLPILPLLRQPTLIIAGTDDPIIPAANAQLMKRLIPRARLHQVEDGHLALLTSAPEVAGEVASFLAETHADRKGAKKK